jgi:multidrug efflux pump subunit AcrB
MAPAAIVGMAALYYISQGLGHVFRLFAVIVSGLVYIAVVIAVLLLCCLMIWWLSNGRPPMRETLDNVERAALQAREWWTEYRARTVAPSNTSAGAAAVAAGEVEQDLEAGKIADDGKDKLEDVLHADPPVVEAK